MPKLNFNTTDEFLAKYKELIGKNPDYTPEEVYEQMVNAKATIGGIALDKFTPNPDEISKMNAITNGDNPQPKGDTPQPKGETVTQDAGQENIVTPGENDWSDFISQARNEDWDDKTLKEKWTIFADDYKKIYKDAVDYIKNNNYGKGLVRKGKEKYNEELAGYVKKIKELEKSPEFSQLMHDISEEGTGEPWYEKYKSDSSPVASTLSAAASGNGSKMLSELGNGKTKFFAKLNGDNVDKNFSVLSKGIKGIADDFVKNNKGDNNSEKNNEVNKEDKEVKKENNENKEWTPSNESPLNGVTPNVSPIGGLKGFGDYLTSKSKK